MKKLSRMFALSVLIGAAFTANSVLACTATQWNGVSTGNPLAGDPPTSTPRVSGKCGLVLSAEGSVRDESPQAETQAFIRFYVLADLSAGDPVIFEAFDGTNASLLTVSFDGSNFTFNAGSGDSAPIQGKAGWNMVELAWIGGDKMDFWVNVDSSETLTGTVAAAAGTMDAVVLGAPAAASFTGTLAFDDYVSHRTTPVGGLALIGDVNNDGAVNVFDVSSMVLELDFFNPQVQEGTPDCNMDGQVNVFDISSLVLAIDFFAPVPCNSNP